MFHDAANGFCAGRLFRLSRLHPLSLSLSLAPAGHFAYLPMRRSLPLLLAAATLFAQGSLAAAGFQRDIPKAPWEPTFFQAIDQLTRQAGWTPLRRRPVPPDSLEVRLWIGFGRLPLQGYSLRRDGSQWRARSIGGYSPGKPAEARLLAPKSGWERLWSRLLELGILTLPDSSSLANEVAVFDGVSYVVEINQNDRYRTYAYRNPQKQKWREARRIRAIVETLQNELTRS